VRPPQAVGEQLRRPRRLARAPQHAHEAAVVAQALGRQRADAALLLEHRRVMVAGLAALEVLQRERLVERVAEIDRLVSAVGDALQETA
jgi:hypothetical protein